MRECGEKGRGSQDAGGGSLRQCHNYTKKELKQMSKSALVDVAVYLQQVSSRQAEELRKADLTIQSLRLMHFGQKSEKEKYVVPDMPPAEPGGPDGEKPAAAGSTSGEGEAEKGDGDPSVGKTPPEKRNKGEEPDPGRNRRHKYGRGGSRGGNPRRTKGCQTKNTEKLPSITVTHKKTDGELLEEFGTLEGVKSFPSSCTEEVIRIPSQTIVVKHQFMTYVKDDRFVPTGTAGDIKLAPGSHLSVSLMASILYERFFRHLPMSRISKDLRSWGYGIGDDALPRWSVLMTDKGTWQLYIRLLEQLLEHRHIQMDETFFRVVHDGRRAGSQSYMWIILPSECDPDAKPVTVYIFDETRSTDVLRYTLGGYSGTISCDGYVDYPVFAKESGGKVTLATCWAHVRRAVARACRIAGIGKIPVKDREGIPCYEALMMLKGIFMEEKPLKGLLPEERRKGRKERVAPKVDAFFEYLRGLPEKDSPMADAAQYALNMEQSLRVFLSDPLVPMTNSNAERAALFFALGRNGFRQKDSLDGAQADAMYYSIAATARACGVNGFLYFQYILEKLPPMVGEHGKRTGGGSQDISYLDALMPWGEDYREYEARHLGIRGAAAESYARELYRAMGYSVA